MVWVKRWALDTRAEIDGAGMLDPRVTHLWDTGNVVGQGFLDRVGVDAVLIGGALMVAPDPEEKVRELTGTDESTREHLV